MSGTTGPRSLPGSDASGRHPARDNRDRPQRTTETNARRGDSRQRNSRQHTRTQAAAEPPVFGTEPVGNDVDLLHAFERKPLSKRPPLIDDLLAAVGYPVMVGVSRKGFIGRLLDGRPTEGRLFWTAAAVALAVGGGARLLRVHDVAVMRDAVIFSFKLRCSNVRRNRANRSSYAIRAFEKPTRSDCIPSDVANAVNSLT